jgi:hypothetical protein
MDIVPNAAFEANFPRDVEFEHPAGCYLARAMRQSLPPVASAVDDFENWRDCGWVLTCEVDGRQFEVYFAAVGTEPVPRTWMLAVAPLGQPGAIRRLFGAKELPYVTQSKMLTAHVHKLLADDPHISNVRWAMNADPLKSNVRDPKELNWGIANVA